MPYKPVISKSKYLVGLQCPKLLWISYNAKNMLPKISDSTQYIFDQGNEVGDLAKKLYPNGKEIAWGMGFKRMIEKSKELLKERIPIYEASFLSNQGFSRIDILNPVNKDEWDLIEVKSSTKVDDTNLHDVSFQKYCCRGLKIRKTFLMHINKEYKRKGELDINKLFKLEDITKEVKKLSPFVKERLNGMLNIIQKSKPDIGIGPFCNKPYICGLKDSCWDFLPEDNVFELNRISSKGFDLLGEGITAIKDIPLGFKLSDKQNIQKDSTINKKTHIDKAAIKSFFKNLKYPIHYFDFETINSAIPLFEDSSPYQQIPFQFSLHIQEKNNKTEHHEFLSEGKQDPRPELLKKMKDSFKDSGSIIVYYKSFEIGRLKEMAEDFPKYKKYIEKLLTRFVDLYVPFSSFHYYNPSQKGSASLKKTMPALTGKGYENLGINEGNLAAREYMRITYTEVDKKEANAVRNNLLEYCGQDTEGMIWMMDELRKMV
ncbi:DUF2779 domain-containing protein [Candidatus Woesearchaeota archaeon]|nr:DUF2779 domain-containing protein [Candidatus Woesearchaeota archaeon]